MSYPYLPIEIMTLILSFLPLKDAIRISIFIRLQSCHVRWVIQQYDRTVIDNIIIDAIADNRLSVFKQILLALDPSTDDNEIIQWVAWYGRTRMMKILLSDPRTDPSARENLAIRNAVVGDHVSTVKLLLQDPRVDPTDAENRVIIAAIENNSVNSLKVLLQTKNVDPSCSYHGLKNQPLREAVIQRNKTAIDILIEDQRVNPYIPRGYSPFEFAVAMNRQTIVKRILQHRLTTMEHVACGIQIASDLGNPEMIKIFAKYLKN